MITILLIFACVAVGCFYSVFVLAYCVLFLFTHPRFTLFLIALTVAMIFAL